MTGLNLGQQGMRDPDVQGNLGDIETGPFSTNVDFYSNSTSMISGPISFGTGTTKSPNTGSGNFVGIDGSGDVIFVPQGYVSGAALSDTMTFNNATFSSLGVTPGTYEWSWGTGTNQNFTLQIGPAAVPDSGSTFALLALALAALLGVNRLLSLRLA